MRSSELSLAPHTVLFKSGLEFSDFNDMWETNLANVSDCEGSQYPEKCTKWI